MFRFLSPNKDDDPLASARALAAWLEQQPPNSLLGLQGRAVELLKRLPTGQHRPDQNLIEAVFLLDEHLADLRVTLTAQYVMSLRGSTPLEAKLWNAMSGLVLAFIDAYGFLLTESASHLSEKRWIANLPNVLGRLIYYRGLDGRCRLLRREQWIPGRWRELHANYALACAHKIEKIPLPLANVEETSCNLTIEEHYLRVLLQQLMNPGNVTPRQIEWAVTQLPIWSRGVALRPTANVAGGFCVDLSSGEGLRRRQSNMVEGQFLYLDPTVLHTRMVQNAMAIRDEMESASGEPRRVLEEQVDALNKLAPCYSLVFKPSARSADRASEAGNACAVFGFKTICTTLAEVAIERTRAVAHGGGYTYSDTASMYVYGFIGDAATGRRPQQEPKEARAARKYGQECHIIDRSATGCCLIVAVSQLSPIEVGMPVALCEDQDGLWALGIVRRIRKLTAAQLEVGVQMIASSVTRVTLSVFHPAQRRAPGALPRAEAITQGARIDGLYLEPVAKSGAPTGKMVVLPTADYKLGQQMVLEEDSETIAVMLRKALEHQTEWTWAELELLGRALS